MKFLNFLALFLLICSQAHSQQKYTLEAMRNVVDNNYNFWICTPPNYQKPDSSKTTLSNNADSSALAATADSTAAGIAINNDSAAVKAKLPLVVFLHGASLCGHDLYRVRRYGSLDAIKIGRDINAVILAPQNPGGSWQPNKISELMDWCRDNYDIDTNRIYVLGMSLGGYGTIDFCATYPEKVAAAMALCGGSSGKGSISNLGKLPLWIVHGTADRRVGIKCSKVIVNEMVANKNDSLLRYTWLPGGSHGAPCKLFYMNETYDWLFSHSLSDSTRRINEGFDLTMASLKGAYQGCNFHGDFLKVIDSNPTAGRSSYAGGSYSGGPLIDYSKCDVHVVRSGDVLVNIAKKYHVTVDQICRLNGISRTSTLRIGQKLRVRAK